MIIDNRPKTHPRKKAAPAPAAIDAKPEPMQTVHSQTEAPVPVLPGRKADMPVRAKTAPLGGLGNLLGGGLGSGIGGVLPILLIAGALQRGRPGIPAQAPRHALPAVPAESLETQTAEVSAASVRSGTKQRRANAGRLPSPPPPKPEAVPEPVPAQTPIRRAPEPAHVKSLLSDLAGYLPGTGGMHASRIAKVIGLADEMRSINTPGEVASFAQPADPLDRHIGLLNVLGRNLPFAGAANLGRASQVLTMVSTLRGGGSGAGLGNMAGMAGMLRNAMGQAPSAQAQPDMKNVTPAQAEGLKNTVNRLLSGMDDKQKDALLSKAKDFLGKR
jgi:hypothetical protein